MLPGGRSTGAWNVPSPLPSSTAILPEPEVRDHQIGPAVPIDVSDGHEERTTGHREASRRLEGAVAVAEPHDNRVGPGVGDRQIGLAVAVEIAGGHGAGAGAGPQCHRRLKRPVAIAGQHGDGVRPRVGDDQIRPAVPIEVRDRNRLRTGARREIHRSRRLEGAVAVAEQHRGAVVAGIRDREIRHEIAIEVAHRDGGRTMPRRVVFVGRKLQRLRRQGARKRRNGQGRGNEQRWPGCVCGHGRGLPEIRVRVSGLRSPVSGWTDRRHGSSIEYVALATAL